MTHATALETLFGHVADKPVPLARLAHLLLSKGRAEQARELCTRAVAMAPDDAEVRALAAGIFNHNVAHWHVHILRDQARNLAYEAALQRAIKPGCRVLEVGTGSGLFAMMAARAGAAQVITCERNPAIAAAASDIILRNGYDDRIRVVAKDSADLEIGIDFDGPADVMVMEPFAANVIGGGFLPIMEQATRRYLRPGARVIPARATIRVALAEDRRLAQQQMGIVQGFDLSAFNHLLPLAYGISVEDDRLALRSEPGDLFSFDFESGGPFPEHRASVTLSAFGGRVNGIVQWMSLTLDDEGCYENRPGVSAFSAWTVRFFPLARPIETALANKLAVVGAHDRASLWIWAQIL